MAKKFLLIPLVIVLLSVLLFGGCAKPAPVTPTPAPPTPAPAPVPAPAPEEVIELKFAHHVPPQSSLHVAFTAFAEEINKRSNGRVKITVYPAEALFKHKDTLDSVAGGLADISYFTHATAAARFPLSNVVDLPFLPIFGVTACRNVQTKLYEEFPEIRNEHAMVKPLWWFTPSDAILHLKSKPVRTLEDLKGIKIRVGATLIPTVEALGATGVYMAPPDLYPAMEKGVVGGTALGWAVLASCRCDELARYHTDVNFGYYGGGVIMNLETWNSLPPDIQDIFNEVIPWAADLRDKLDLEEGERVRTKCVEEYGDTVDTLSPEELERWKEKLMPIWEDYVANAEAKGLPGRKVLDETLRLGELYSK